MAHVSMDEQTRGLLGVVVILRAALIVWAVVVVAVDMSGTTQLRGPLAVASLSVFGLWSAAFAWLLFNRPNIVMSGWFVVCDLAISAASASLDPIVYPGDHPQSFASAWPLSGAVVAGIVFGPRLGAAGGFVIGAIGAASVGLSADGGLDGRILGALGTVVLLSVSGALAGLVSERLRQAELTRARAQIREDVSRKLHDGVLQTLAVIQRRSSDAELVSLARDQDTELRSFIAAPVGAELLVLEPTTISTALRSVLRAEEKRHGLRCELVVADEPEEVTQTIADAITGAVTEAITNAAKHGHAERVTVFVDADDGVLTCEVSDDGVGFETEEAVPGVGLSRSIGGRISEAGGSVEISSTLGRGTRLRLSVPLHQGRTRAQKAGRKNQE